MSARLRDSVLALFVITATIALVACGNENAGNTNTDDGEEEHAVVDSGTYTGTITEVNADENEIYVDANGKELELYFIDKTKLTKQGKEVDFSTLENGQKVEVKVKKVGKRLDPLSVDILE